MNKKVVFIMGTGHCGSTLVDLILGSNANTFSLGEIHTVDEQKAIRVEGYPKICGVCDDPCKIWNKKYYESILTLYFSKDNIFYKIAGKLARFIVNPYKIIMKWTSKPVLIDSSKQPGWIKNQLMPEYAWRDIDVYLLYVVRDGRAVVNSYHRKYPARGIESVVSFWKKKAANMNMFYEKFSNGKKMMVRYEDLASDPVTHVKKLCLFLDIPYSIDMLCYWKHDHHHIGGNKGTKRLILNNRKNAAQPSESQEDITNEIKNKIHLDEKWKTELSNDEKLIFEQNASELNGELGYKS